MLKLEMRENAWLLAGVLAAGLLFAYGFASGNGQMGSWTSSDLSDKGSPPRAAEDPGLSTAGGTDPYSADPYASDPYSGTGQP